MLWKKFVLEICNIENRIWLMFLQNFKLRSKSSFVVKFWNPCHSILSEKKGCMRLCLWMFVWCASIVKRFIVTSFCLDWWRETCGIDFFIWVVIVGLSLARLRSCYRLIAWVLERNRMISFYGNVFIFLFCAFCGWIGMQNSSWITLSPTAFVDRISFLTRYV